MMRTFVIALVLAACAGEHRDGRVKYNEGVAALARSDFEAAEKALLDARNAPGVDPELLFRTAYDLGVAYAGHADQKRLGKDADLEKALELAEDARTWFGQAQRLRPDDADTKTNLGIVRARIQAIGDELRKGEGKLEVRLDRLIGQQRGVLDGAREAWRAIKQTGGNDPLAQRAALILLADRERAIGAEAGVVGDLAADEIDAIGKKPEDKRSEDEKVRVVQLKNLDLYLLDGRTRIGEARRKLQELATEDGVGRAEAALVALKRAREQLVDPITVMRQIASDELEVRRDSTIASSPSLPLGHALPLGGPADAALPGWLEPAVIAERQGGVRDRLEEVRARLTAATEAPPADPAKSAPPEDPKRAKLVERIKAALPAVGEASAAMDRARQALAGKQVKPALDDEDAALDALVRAVEQFSDLKQLIELAYGEQQGLVQLLGPEAAKALDAGKRANQTQRALAHNVARMPRLRELIADEVTQLEHQAAKAAEPPKDPPKDPKAAEQQAEEQKQQKQQLEQARQQLARAEELRGQAEAALAALGKALAANQDPVPPAKDADAKLTELRKLFFSVIEHLKELIRTQGETRDQTAAADGEDDFTRAPKLPGLVDQQAAHQHMAKAITDALAQQADAAGKQPAQGPKQGPDAKALAGAADEVRQAQGDMTEAATAIAKARDAKNQTVRLEPGVVSQAKAIEHLENALKLLEPPKQDKNDKNDQQQQQQQPQQKPQPQQQQGGAGQRARDADARQQKKKAAPQSEPVEKDW